MNRAEELRSPKRTASLPKKTPASSKSERKQQVAVQSMRNSTQKLESITPVKTANIYSQSTAELTSGGMQGEYTIGKDGALVMTSPAKTIASRQHVEPGAGQKDNVKVVIRVRPISEREKHVSSRQVLLVEEGAQILLDRGMDQKTFTFDYVADTGTAQEEIFAKVAQPLADSCL